MPIQRPFHAISNGIHRRTVLIIAAVVLAFSAFIVVVAPIRIGVGTLSAPGVRFFGEPVDPIRFAYLGRWSQESVVPYRDYGAEYPPLAVVLFGAMNPTASSVTEYRATVATVMAAAAFGVVALCLVLLDRLKLPRSRVFLLLLPAALYYTMNRYDILVPLLVLPALLALLNHHDRLAGFLLAVAVPVKFIPLLLLPLFLRARQTDPVQPVRWYRSPLLYVFVLTFVVTHLAAFLWVGQDFSKGYFAQLSRDAGLGGLLAVIALPFTRNAQSLLAVTLLNIFRGLALIPALGASFAGLPKEPEQRNRALVLLIGLILTASVLFAPFVSPQWILWLTPLLLLVDIKPSRLWIGLLIAFDLTTYLQVPVALDMTDPFALPFYLATVVRTAVLVGLLVLLLSQGGTRFLLDLTPKPEQSRAGG